MRRDSPDQGVHGGVDGVEELPDVLAERCVWGGRRVRGVCVCPEAADCLPEGTSDSTNHDGPMRLRIPSSRRIRSIATRSVPWSAPSTTSATLAISVIVMLCSLLCLSEKSIEFQPFAISALSDCSLSSVRLISEPFWKRGNCCFIKIRQHLCSKLWCRCTLDY